MYTDIDWIDPKKALPPENKMVLVRLTDESVQFSSWSDTHGWQPVIKKYLTGWYPLEWL